MKSDVIEYISGIIINNIQPNLLQIANSEFVKYINTGDRIKDSAYVLILNSILLIFVKLIYKCAFYLYSKFNTSNTSIDYIDAEQVCKDNSLDSVIKYKYKFEFEYLDAGIVSLCAFINWLSLNNIGMNSSQTDSCSILCNIIDVNCRITADRIKKHAPLIGLNCKSNFKNCFTPVYKYKINNKIEYIFLVGQTLYSNSLQHLDYMFKLFVTEIDKINKSEYVKKTIQIHEINYEKYHLISLGDINGCNTFDTLYFDNKLQILEWVNKFQNKQMYPKGLSLVNKLGILLYGPPGTGKTGFICALANYLNRDILMINALNVQNNEQNKLRDIINKCKNTHIIVFDEFDYILNATISNDNDIDKYTELLAQTTDSIERKNIYKLMQKNKADNNDTALDNRFILSLLDGLGNDDGRIIIATTNNPENINPAFIRPGRFDVVQKLGFCSFSMFKSIVLTKYETFTEEFFEQRKSEINSILSLNITPLVLINNLINSNSMDELFILLSKLKQQNYNKIIE